MKLIDLTGKQFGLLVVLRREGTERNGFSTWRCQCDCGNEVVVRSGNLRIGDTKTCGASVHRRGKNNPQWNGGRGKHSKGYIVLRGITRIDGNYSKGVLEHVFVMESHLGRRLFSDETVHHKNGVRDDNRIENLELRVGYHPQGST